MSDSSTRSSLGSDVSSGDIDWVTYYELESLNLKQKQALGKSLHILKSLIGMIGGEEYDDDEDLRDITLELERHVWEAETMRVSKQNSFDTHFASKVSTVEIQSLAAKESGVSRSGTDELLPRELFQETNEKKRSSDIDLEEEADEPQMKRIRTTTESEDENDSDDSSMDSPRKNEDLSPEKEADTAPEKAEQQRLADEQREQEVARAQREKEELEQQEMAAKKQQRLAAQQHEHDRIEREKEATRVQQQQEVPRRLQQEKEVAEQEKVPKEAEAAKAKEAAAKAAHQQRLKERRERDRLSRARKKKSEMVKECSDILQRCIKMKNDESSTHELGAKFNLIGMLSDMIDTTFDGQNNLNLDEIIQKVVTLVGPSIKYNSVVSTSLSNKASKMATTFANNGNVSLGELLDSCDSNLDTVDQTMDEDIIRLKKIIYQYTNPGVQMSDITEAEYEKVGPTALSNFVKLSNPMSHMLQHLLNLSVISSMFEDLKLSDLAAHQPQKDAAALLSGAAELAELVDPDVPFDDSMTIMSILQQFVFPGFDEDNAWILAAKTLISICDGMTNVGTSPEQVKAYETNILTLIRTKQSNSLSGERVESGVDFFGGSGATYNSRRRRAARTFLMVALKKVMLQICPNGLFDSSGGYTRSVLRLSPSNMYNKSTFVNHDLVEEEHLGEDSDEVDKIKTDVLNKQKPNDGEKILIFDSSNDEQLGSMKFLLTAWSNIPPK